MSAAAAGTSAMFNERIDPGRIASFLLAAAMHLALFAVLVFGVRWQNRPPEAVVVELWNEPVAAPVQAEPKPAPVPEPVVVKPEPVIAKPEIAEKAPPPKPKPIVKAEPKPKPKAEPPKVAARPRDEEAQRQIREQVNREQFSMAIDREQQQLREQRARAAAAANSKALETWVSSIQVHIRNRINKNIADAVPGNPASVFVVTLLPNCEVLKISILKSGGNKAYDNEVERAILRSSPLPKPDKAEIFDRELRLTFRPKDKDQI
jgi:colicin import membrane protein